MVWVQGAACRWSVQTMRAVWVVIGMQTGTLVSWAMPTCLGLQGQFLENKVSSVHFSCSSDLVSGDALPCLPT